MGHFYWVRHAIPEVLRDGSLSLLNESEELCISGFCNGHPLHKIYRPLLGGLNKSKSPNWDENMWPLLKGAHFGELALEAVSMFTGNSI